MQCKMQPSDLIHVLVTVYKVLVCKNVVHVHNQAQCQPLPCLALVHNNFSALRFDWCAWIAGASDVVCNIRFECRPLWRRWQSEGGKGFTFGTQSVAHISPHQRARLPSMQLTWSMSLHIIMLHLLILRQVEHKGWVHQRQIVRVQHQHLLKRRVHEPKVLQLVAIQSDACLNRNLEERSRKTPHSLRTNLAPPRPGCRY